VGQRQLEPLHLFIRDRIETLRAERWNEMPSEDGFDRVNAARLVTVRPRVTVDESRRECFECGHLPLWRRRAMLEQIPFAILRPSLRR
jgi:hypothetical protein